MIKHAMSLWGPLLALLYSSNSLADDSFLSNPVGKAVRHGDCVKAAAAVNDASPNPDSAHAFTLFVAARMLDEGICTQLDPIGAAGYYQVSGLLGIPQAQFEFAAKIGMGQGVPQNYETAGHACRSAGVDNAGVVPLYSLGYACTVGAVAARLLRLSLPTGSFHLPTKPAIVEFDVISARIHVISTPTPQHGQTQTDSLIPPSLVEPEKAFPKAFRDALAIVPKPDVNSLRPANVSLPLDVDITIEGGTEQVKNSPVIRINPFDVVPGVIPLVH